jgi:hypothetical protein
MPPRLPRVQISFGAGSEGVKGALGTAEVESRDWKGLIGESTDTGSD